MKPGGDGVAVTGAVETSASWDGALLSAYPQGRPQVTILRAPIPPRAALPVHTHAIVNAGIILRGELTVIAETAAERTFRAGEGVVEQVGAVHYGEHRSDGVTGMVMFYAGTQGVSLSGMQKYNLKL